MSKLHRIKNLLLVGLLALLSLGFAGPLHAQEANEGDYVVQVTQVDTSNFPEINVWVSVTDGQGNPIRTLPDSAFQLVENGQAVELKEVFQAGEQGPVTTVLVIDRSGSMKDVGKLDAAKAAAHAYVDLMRPEDAAGIVVFNTQVEVVQAITADQAALNAAIDGITAFDDTAMYDALATAAEVVKGVDGRRAIILLSDGLDNRSQRQIDEVLAALGAGEVSVYTIGLGDPSAGLGSTSGIDEAALQRIANETRGAYAYTPNPDDLTALYEGISLRLQNEYRLTYITTNALYDGVNRGIEVQIASAGTGAVAARYNPGGVIPETATPLPWRIFGGVLLALVALILAPEVVRRLGQRRPRPRRVRLKDTGSVPRPSSGPGRSRVRVHNRHP
jgi:VWFA-related protein